MLEDDLALHARYADARPGMQLIAIEDAAIPVTIVQTEVLAQERKPLALLNEFVLRFARAGVSTPAGIASLCGLEPSLVESAVADEVAVGHMSHAPSRGTIALTPLGVRTSTELEAIQPVQRRLHVTFDRLTWQVADYNTHELLRKKEAVEDGRLLLPAARTSRIGNEEITTPVLNSLLRSQGPRRPEILAVRKITPNTHRYLPVNLLVYGDDAGEEIEVSVVVNDESSSQHDLALARAGGAAAIGVSVAPPEPRPKLDESLEGQRLQTTEPLFPEPAGQGVSQSSVLMGQRVRALSMLEHRELLESSLMHARKRLLIISPWVKNAVVNNAFVGMLEQRLRAGVAVHIAHGFGSDDKKSDARALQRLAELHARFKDRFTLVRLSNTHAKVLICDDNWVSTSFNWLSFRGDPDRTYRMEEGTLVTIPSVVDEQYERYVEVIERERLR